MDKNSWIIWAIVSVVALIIIICLNYFSNNIQSNNLNKSAVLNEKNNIKNKESLKLLDELILRCKRNRKYSFLMLALTFFILILGFFSFYYAQKIAINDREEQINQVKNDIEKAIHNKYMNMLVNGNTLDSLNELAKYKNINKGDNIETVELQHKGLEAFKTLKKIEGMVESKFTNKILMETDSLYKKQIEISSNLKIDTYYFIFTTTSIRIIIALITFYIAQLLIKLFKYYQQVSDFYLSRTDAIKAFKEKEIPVDFLQLVETFQHQKDIGTLPKNPSEYFIESIKSQGQLRKTSID